MSSDFGAPKGRAALPNPWPARVALAVGCVVVMIWTVFGVIKSLGDAADPAGAMATDTTDPTTAMAGMLGYAMGGAIATVLIAAGVVFLPLYFFFIKPSKRPRGPKYFGILALAGVATAVLMSGAFFMVSPTISADREVNRALNDYTGAINADEQAFAADLAGKGLDGELSMGGIARDLAGSEARVASAMALVDKYDALRDQRRADMRAKIAAAYTDPKARDKALKDFDEGEARTRALIDERWEIERRGLKAQGDIIAFLKQTRGRYVANGDNLTFYRQGDLARIQTLKLTLDSIIMEQMSVRTRHNLVVDQINAERQAAAGRTPARKD